MIMKFFITFQNETVLYICHSELALSTLYRFVCRIMTPRRSQATLSYLPTCKSVYTMLSNLSPYLSRQPLLSKHLPVVQLKYRVNCHQPSVLYAVHHLTVPLLLCPIQDVV